MNAAAQLARDLDRHADHVDGLATRVEQLAERGVLSHQGLAAAIQRDALMLKSVAQSLSERIDASGARRTWYSFNNEAGIALGASAGHHYGQGGVHYRIEYAIREARNTDGRFSSAEGAARVAASGLRVGASSLRVHAANCRVIRDLYRKAAAGEIVRVG